MCHIQDLISNIEVSLNNSIIFSKIEFGRFPNEKEGENILDDYEWIT